MNYSLAPFEPTATDAWDRRKVAHLYRRAAFGATWAELETGVKLGPEGCVNRILRGSDQAAVNDSDFAAMARTAVAAASDRSLQGWWIYRMLAGPHPLVERLTLFWHDHFATSQEKVANLGLMRAQNELFRKFALGQFWDRQSGGLLLEVSRDPAMLLWLDSNSNRRSAPNENYARELMELFALGIGHYTEQDIQEAARAFTGWFVHGNRFRFNDSEHDPGEKSVLGELGAWDGSDVVRIVAEQPAAAELIAGKLYRFFVNEHEPPDAELLSALAAGFREHDYQVHWVVKTLLRSQVFYSRASYRQKIAAPLDFTLGTVRRLEGQRVSPVHLADVCSKLGQTLFHPPNVAGWEEGRSWINSSSLVGRSNFAQEIVASQSGRFAGRTDPAALAAKYGCTSQDDVLDFFLNLLVDGDVPDATRTELRNAWNTAPQSTHAPQRDAVRRLVQLILSLPEYNLC
jgi:uncharacterized protein (DUF1800 family)